MGRCGVVGGAWDTRSASHGEKCLRYRDGGPLAMGGYLLITPGIHFAATLLHGKRPPWRIGTSRQTSVGPCARWPT